MHGAAECAIICGCRLLSLLCMLKYNYRNGKDSMPYKAFRDAEKQHRSSRSGMTVRSINSESARIRTQKPDAYPHWRTETECAAAHGTHRRKERKEKKMEKHTAASFGTCARRNGDGFLAAMVRAVTEDRKDGKKRSFAAGYGYTHPAETKKRNF